MKKFQLVIIKIKLITLSALVFFANGVALGQESLPYFKDASFSPYWIDDSSIERQTFHKIPSFNFVDQNGTKISEKTFEGKVYVAGFFFSTCPGICPAVRSKLNKVQKEFSSQEQVKILQHSIRPSYDSVDVLQEYARANGIKSGHWYLATGERDDIYALAKSAYFASEDLGNLQNTNDFLHTESLLLIDENRHIRGVYNGLNAASVNYLIADIKLLINQKTVSAR